MTRIKTVRERTSVPSQLAGIVAVVVPPLGLVAAVWLLWDRSVRPVDLALLAGFYVACGLGITVGFHRLFTHKSFETSAPLRAVWAILGAKPCARAYRRRRREASPRVGDCHWISGIRALHIQTSRRGAPRRYAPLDVNARSTRGGGDWRARC